MLWKMSKNSIENHMKNGIESCGIGCENIRCRSFLCLYEKIVIRPLILVTDGI